MACLKSPAAWPCLFLPLVNLSERNISPLSHSRKNEWKGINKSKLLAGLISATLVQFTFLLHGFVCFFFNIAANWKVLFSQLSRHPRQRDQCNDAHTLRSRDHAASSVTPGINWEKQDGLLQRC